MAIRVSCARFFFIEYAFNLGYTTLDMANFTIALGIILINEISNLLGVKTEKECGKPIWNKIN